MPSYLKNIQSMNKSLKVNTMTNDGEKDNFFVNKSPQDILTDPHLLTKP